MAILTLVIIFSIVFGHRSDIYPWLDKEAVNHDEVLKGKSSFLNPTFYSIASVLFIGLWSLISKKLRDFSRESDRMGTMDYETGKKWMNRNLLLGCFLRCVIWLISWFYNSVAMDYEYRRTLVQYYV